MRFPPRSTHVVEITRLAFRPGDSVSCSLAGFPICTPWLCVGFWPEDPEVVAVQAAPVSRRSFPQSRHTRPTWGTSPSTPCRVTSTPSSKTSVWGACGSSVTKRQTNSKVSCFYRPLLVHERRCAGELQGWAGGLWNIHKERGKCTTAMEWHTCL